MSYNSEDEICEKCIHHAKNGECRKYAPRGGADGNWPVVEDKDWCGEFKGTLLTIEDL